MHVPNVDGGKADARGVLDVVMEVEQDSFFKLDTCNGISKQLYVRSQFQ